MLSLDSKTTQRLAEVIVDMGGPYERTSRQLAELFLRSGWADPPEYDGSPRVTWVYEQLEERRDRHAEIERLICRVCDPIEYDDGLMSAEDFRTVINQKIEPERLVVTYAGGRPVLGELGVDGSTAVFTTPADLESRLQGLISDTQTVDMLMNRARETAICESGGAYTMAIIGIGSLVEGVLLAMLLERDEELRTQGFMGRNGQRIKEQFVGLEMLIDTAHAKDWIQLDATTFIHEVRNFRNFIHPRKELAEKPQFDKDSVMLCWAPVQALLNDLEQNVTPAETRN